jgi:predicted unusual protein kinase regulating ubiquinone biosynthesis (AarF/ABC1/UbiB family)
MTIGRRLRRARTTPGAQAALGELGQLAQAVRSDAAAAVPLDRGRYLRVAYFFARLFLSFIGWNLILAHIPGFRAYARSTNAARWRAYARKYRALAVRYGGVLIKLGQFLSIRVDILPADVTAELRGLQDEVPAESFADVRTVIEAEFGRQLEQVYAWFSSEPKAAASLAQVHLARLADGEEVVVKVQRLRIERLVETDLAALRLATNWLKWYRPVSRHADLDRLYDEFARTTRAELDFEQEGRNADRFAADFARDRGIYIADVFWDLTTRRVLTLENVSSIKIDDVQAIEAAGISRSEVAGRLYDTYLEQIFVHSFVHADPHPGNLFIHPLDLPPDAPPGAPRPFWLIFVDFGMVAVIPDSLRGAMRDVAIAVGTRDARRLVQAYYDAGVLLPGADRQRIEELHEVMFARFGGVRMGQLSDVAMQQAGFLIREYRDLLYDLPFQFPTDILFAIRAVAILSGMATTLDPHFDPWAATLPFAERLAQAQLTRDWRSVLDELGSIAQLALLLPQRLDRFLTAAERGELVQQTALAPDAARAIKRLERTVDRLTWTVAGGGLLIAGMMFRASDGSPGVSTALFIGAGVLFLWGLLR